MQNELKEKLQNLSEKFNTDLDVISLKALCSVPENEEILFAITGTLNRLIEKYPDDEEILGLLPKKEKISLESLIEVLQETYPNNAEIFTIKALSTFSEEELREKAIAQSLERLLEVNPNDENIMEYLEIEDVVPKEKNPDMVFVEGGSYTPSFFNEERSVIDLYVNKYVTTQDDWEEIMKYDDDELGFDIEEYYKNMTFYKDGEEITFEELKKQPDFLKNLKRDHYERHQENRSKHKGNRRPITDINWIQVLEYCNKLSKKYNLKPVYKIEDFALKEDGSVDREKIPKIKIIQLNGKEVYPNDADFSMTEGYRLPTELEWEWFAFGGKIAIENDTFYKKSKLGRDSFYKENIFSDGYTRDVGVKRANELGLYDLIGNINQMVYDNVRTAYGKMKYIPADKPYSFDSSKNVVVLRGASFDHDLDYNPFLYNAECSIYSVNSTIGFRVVRTANPKRR